MRGIIRQERIEKRRIYRIEGLPEGGRRVLSGMLAEGGRRRAVRDVGKRWYEGAGRRCKREGGCQGECRIGLAEDGMKGLAKDGMRGGQRMV